MQGGEFRGTFQKKGGPKLEDYLSGKGWCVENLLEIVQGQITRKIRNKVQNYVTVRKQNKGAWLNGTFRSNVKRQTLP
jgi:hypothetical protein